LQHKTLLLTLRTFSSTGGIEKVSKVAGKALYEICKEQNEDLQIFCLYDQTNEADTRYFPQSIFQGFNIKKWKFASKSVSYGVKCQLVVLTHIHLLPIGYLIKLISPKTKLILLAHGIEVFPQFSMLKRRMIQQCDLILAVSRFTKHYLVEKQILSEDQVNIMNNCLDPFLKEPLETEKNKELLKRYGFKRDDVVLMSLCRMSSDEGYKGYDKVIECLHELQKDHLQLKYMVAGKYDEKEKNRVEQFIDFFDVKDRVVLTGFIPDSELADHFHLADIFIMPSEQEGFGIAFIEAMYYNKPVIAGNKDGSVDALLDGKLGVLINPDNVKEVSKAIQKILLNTKQFLPDGKFLNDYFSYPVYRAHWRAVLINTFGNGGNVVRGSREPILAGTTNSQLPLSDSYPILTLQKELVPGLKE
jgi:phosphatidyl-myo-inositol dimannoside synthase